VKFQINLKTTINTYICIDCGVAMGSPLDSRYGTIKVKDHKGGQGMRGAMESVTRMALEEMIVAHANESRFGYVLSQEGMRELVDTLYEFFETSRSLKAAGDRLIQQGMQPPGARAGNGRLGR
jgi:hypothetical protein